MQLDLESEDRGAHEEVLEAEPDARVGNVGQTERERRADGALLEHRVHRHEIRAEPTRAALVARRQPIGLTQQREA